MTHIRTNRRRLLQPTLGAALAATALVVVDPGAAPAAPVPSAVNECHSTDNAPPVVTGFETSATTVDVSDGPATVTITMHVHDEGGPGPASGIDAAHASYLARSPRDSAPALTGVVFHQTAPDTWTGELTVAAHSTVEQYSPSSWVVYDAAGRRTATFPDEEGQLPRPPTITVIADPRDVEAPEVTVLEVTPDTVHPRHRPTVVSVHVDATDDLAGVASVELTAFKDVSDADTTAGVLRTASLAPDEAAPGTWTGMLRLPPGLGNGAWRLSLEALDTAGNARWLSAQELADLGLPASLGYTSPRDLTRPTLVSPRISPARIDVRERAGTVAVRVEARDDDSGIEKVVADPEFLPGGPDDVVLRRVSGTARHGVWQGSFEVPECLVPGGAQQVTVRARDRAGNVRRAHPRLVVQARTTLPPDARLGRTSEIPTAGPVVLRFPRPVTGISTDEVLVADAYGPLDPSAVAVPGSWRCWREEVHARRATSCLDGRVRRAEFTPGDGFAPGTGYLVDLAPTHHLGVIDLHGNPLEEWRTFRTASA